LTVGDPRIAKIPFAPVDRPTVPTTHAAPNAVPFTGVNPLPAQPNVLGAVAERHVVVPTTIAATNVVPDAGSAPASELFADAVREFSAFPARTAAPTAVPTTAPAPSPTTFANVPSAARPATAAGPGAPVVTELSAPRPEFSATLHLLRLAELFQKPLSIDATRKFGIDGEPPVESKTRPQARRYEATDDPATPSEPATRTETPRVAEPATERREADLGAARSPRTPEAQVLPQPAAKDVFVDPSRPATVSDVRSGADPQFVAAHRASILEQVRDSLTGRAEAGGNVRLTLHPKELGRLDVRLQVHDGAMSAWIVADDKAVRDVLMSQQHELRQSLESQGMKLQEFSVSVRDDRQPAFRDFTGQAGDGRDRSHGESSAVSAVGGGENTRHSRYIDPRALVDLVV
jgi:hypothetical protein